MKPMNKKIIFFFCCALLFMFSRCKDNPIDGEGIFPPTLIPFVAYNSPVWHPDGQFIGFNHTPIKSIHYSGNNTYPDKFELERESSGFWLINSDGTNMRRIFPYTLLNPAWSPDGNWIAFVAGAQIYKMRFTGTTFDTTTLVQLTTEGRNFFPSWSPDGWWIAYDRSLADSSGPGGIWVMKNDGTMKHSLFGGAFPNWHPGGNILIGVIGTSSTSIWTRFVRYNFNQSTMIDTLPVIVGNYNLLPRYSPDGTKIAFTSQPYNGQAQVWLMNADGSGKHQLTTEGVEINTGSSLSWDTLNNLIVYTKYRFDNWPPQNGTLWIINANTGQQQQLTFNPLSTN